jgi:N-acetyl sugar amidotransferase
VSGGKDSTWQTVVCLERGLNPLAVTWKTPARTELGQANLENLVSLGVDHIDYQVDPRVEARFMLASLERFGTTAIPMHMALFNIPLTIAVRFRIPLVVWGENSAVEYGGDVAHHGFRLDRAWLDRFGVMHGTTAADWVSDTLTERDLTPYRGASDEELEAAGTHAVFLGHYFEWDPQRTAEVARAHGFRGADRARTGFYDFADVDDDFISIHHWLKWLKFGFTRTFDNLSLEIRNGRLSRGDAVAMIRARGDETPHADIARFCDFAGIPRERFFEIAERFRSPDVWTRRGGTWTIDGFLVPDWDWSAEEGRAAA